MLVVEVKIYMNKQLVSQATGNALAPLGWHSLVYKSDIIVPEENKRLVGWDFLPRIGDL